MSDELVRERQGNILIARLNRPEVRNAINIDLMAQIGKAVIDAEDDPDIRAVVLTGTGDRAFCGGMDLREFAGRQPPTSDPTLMAGFRRFSNGEATVPIIGAANATAVAGGFELLLSCDLIVASRHAKFGLPEVKRGLFPGGTGGLLGARVPLAIALEMLMTGDNIDAERAYQLGLVNAVVDPEDVLKTALDYAARIARNGPLAAAAVKELAWLSVTDYPGAKKRSSELQPVVFGSLDAKEGASAFVEKRDPVWQGK